MNDDKNKIDTIRSQMFALSRWTRSSGRVIEQGATDRKQRFSKDIKTHTRTSRDDFVKIFRKFLDLQNEESADLADAASYGIRLFCRTEGKQANHKETNFIPQPH